MAITGKLGKFQMTDATAWKGLSKNNHLASVFGAQPQKASNLMVQILAANRGKTLETLLSQFPTKEFDDDSEYYWDIIGSSRRNIPLVECRDENGIVVTPSTTSMVGVGVASFYLVFAEDWFADGEIIVGNLNEAYLFRILGEAKMEGTNAVYKVELMGGNTTGCPPERLLAGERFSIEYAPVERELSRKVGDVRFNSSASMRNEWSTVRIQHKVPGTMLGKKLCVGIPVINHDNKKDVISMWMHKVDYEVECQFSDYKNNLLAFGRSNRNANGEYLNFGKSGEVIRMGAGLFEQMEVSNTMYYNTFSIKLLEDALYELSASKLDFKERTFVIKTGERGAIQFSKAALKEGSGWTMFNFEGVDLGIAQKTTSKMTPFGGGIKLTAPIVTELVAPNGVYVKIDIDPYYDDIVRNKIKSHKGGPAYSYRYDIFDMGTMDQPNIFKCKIKGEQEKRGYQWGPFSNPFTGQTNNGSASYDEDSAVIHKMATLGICVLDPTRTMSLIPSELEVY